MVTDGIMAAVQIMISKFNTQEERNAGEAILDMLGDYDEDHWYSMNDDQVDKWLNEYMN